MDDDLRDVVASNVNEEVAVFRGSSTGELMSMAVICVAVITPTMSIIGAFFDKAIMMFSLSLVVVFVAMFLISTWMQRIRRGRPDGYFEQRIVFFRTSLGFGSCPFVRYNGQMDIYRTEQILTINQIERNDSE